MCISPFFILYDYDVRFDIQREKTEFIPNMEMAGYVEETPRF